MASDARQDTAVTGREAHPRFGRLGAAPGGPPAPPSGMVRGDRRGAPAAPDPARHARESPAPPGGAARTHTVRLEARWWLANQPHAADNLRASQEFDLPRDVSPGEDIAQA